MPPVPDLPPNLEYQYHLYRQDSPQQWHQDPKYKPWYPEGCVPGPMPIHSPTYPPPNPLRRYQSKQKTRPKPYPSPRSQPQSHSHSQPQMTQVAAEGHHSQPPKRPPSRSSLHPAEHPQHPSHPSSQPQTTQLPTQGHHSQPPNHRARSQSKPRSIQPQPRSHPLPQPQPQSHPHSQPQMTQAHAQGGHSQPPNRPPSQSSSRPAEHQPQSYLHSQPQMTQVPGQGHHFQSPKRPRSPSRSRPVQRQTRSSSLPPARNTRSQSRNPRPATPTRTQSRSPYPHREDDGRRAILKGIANETIGALNNDFVDVSTTKQHTELFLESSQELTDWRLPRSHHLPSIQTHIEVLALSTLKGARHLHDLAQPRSKIGVLNFASATSPGGGFLNGARAQEESIARSSSLYVSLTTDTARPFYALHAGRNENNGFYTHAMIYSPEVHLFRDDDGGWLDAIPVDIVTSPAVNAGKVRRRYPHRDGLERKIEDAMYERMGRILALFEMKGATSLVLGSFGTGVFQNDVGMVARIWRDLLINRSGRFRTAFREVVFCIPDAQTRGVFEAALYSHGGRRGPYVPGHGRDRDGVP